ncbi:MAG: argininosuccinate lyase [Sporichthyaceae bacterium]
MPQYAPELIAGGFAIEVADAELLHVHLGLADLAHTLVLARRGVIPDEPLERLLSALLEAQDTPAAEIGYDPALGELYNCREEWLAARIGTDGGWLNAGRPRREAVRIAMRLRLRRDVLAAIDAAAVLAEAIADQAERHAETWMAEQTYLQHSQPSTFGHYLLSFSYAVLRDMRRLEDCLAWVNRSPGGAGGVNGSALTPDRWVVAGLLGFDDVIEHTRDAMWQTDGLIALLSAVSSLGVTAAKLAEDLEIWASDEFDWVRLADGHSRGSVLMPNKRNPYALTMVRGTAGVLIGRLTGMLAVTKSPSARSDNLIFAYGEVPRAMEMAVRQIRLLAGVVDGLEVNAQRMWAALENGFTQAADLAEQLMTACQVDYRSAHRIVGAVVRSASAAGLRAVDIDASMLAAAAAEIGVADLDTSGLDLADVLDPKAVVGSRTTLGGAAPETVRGMAADVRRAAQGAAAAAASPARELDAVEAALLAEARDVAGL